VLRRLRQRAQGGVGFFDINTAVLQPYSDTTLGVFAGVGQL
jgi:hypothetical protein